MVIQIGRLEEPVSFPKDTSEWHSFLAGNVEKALKIRRHVENLPETSATWRLNDVDGLDPQGIHRGIVKLTGAWKVPHHITNNRDRHWVNPNHVHAQHYSDAVVECGCGIPVLRQSFGENEKQPAHHQEHNDCCNKIYRTEARLQLLKNRREIVKDVYDYGHSATGMIERLGYPERREMGAGDAKDLGLNLGKLAREGRKKVARTAMVLCREHSPETIAKIYGVHRRSISEILTQETKTSSKKLYSVRRSVA